MRGSTATYLPESLPLDDPSLRVMVARLSGNVDVESAHHLLPRLLDDIPDLPRKRNGKVLYPLFPLGTIINLNYGGHVRGISPGEGSEGCFGRSSDCIRMSGVTRNVSIKLSRDNIHITGKISCDETCIVANTLLKHLRRIQSKLSWISTHKDVASSIVEEILFQTKGSPVDEESQPRHSIVEPLYVPNSVITNFILDMAGDFLHHEDFAAKLWHVLSLDSVISGNIRISAMERYVLNYNYSLGCHIDAHEIVRVFEREHDFLVRFDPSKKKHVTVEFPHGVMNADGDPIKDTLLIYQKGTVVHSGSTEERSQRCFHRFMEVLRNASSKVFIPAPFVLRRAYRGRLSPGISRKYNIEYGEE